MNNKKTTQSTSNEATAQKTKNPFKSILIIVMILLIVGIISTTMLFIAYKTNTNVRDTLNHLYYSEIYSGNRNIGTVAITIDGQPYQLEENDFSIDSEAPLMDCFKIDKITINDDSSAEVQIVAGEKAMYIYYINADNVEYPIPFRFSHMACWYFSEYDLSVNVDTKNHTFTYDGYYILNGVKTDINKTVNYYGSLDGIYIIPPG